MKRVLAKMDKSLLFFVIVLAVFGLVMIFSASNVKATVDYDNPYLFFFRQLRFLGLGIIAFIIIMKVETIWYVRLDKIIILGTVGILVLCLMFGAETRSARSWFLGVQPSEFAKLSIILVMATMYERMLKKKKDDINSIMWPLIFAGIVVGLVAIQPDFGTAAILLGIAGLLFISVPIKGEIKWKIFGICAVAVVLLLGIVILSGKFSLLQTQIDRFNFLSPCSRYTASTGYQVCNGYIAINNGGVFGVGLGNSTQKYLYLPEAHNDFIYPIIVEELGLVAGVIVIFIYMYIMWRCLVISKQSTTLRGSMIAYGVCCFFFCQVCVNLVGVLGLFPLTGVPLPFLSAGGSMLLTAIIAIALVERVALETSNDLKKRALGKN